MGQSFAVNGQLAPSNGSPGLSASGIASAGKAVVVSGHPYRAAAVSVHPYQAAAVSVHPYRTAAVSAHLGRVANALHGLAVTADVRIVRGHAATVGAVNQRDLVLILLACMLLFFLCFI